MRYFNRAVLAAAMLAGLAACASPGTPSSSGPAVDPSQSTYMQFIAGDNAVAIVMQTASGLTTTCVIKPASPTWQNLDTAFKALASGLDAGNTAVQAGNTDLASTDLNAVLVALQSVEASLNQVTVPANAKSAMLARTRAASSSVESLAPVIIGLVIQNLPLLISEGSQLATVVQSYINQASGGASGKPLTVADVATANGIVQNALAAWEAAGALAVKSCAPAPKPVVVAPVPLAPVAPVAPEPVATQPAA
jgi:hypothetical protein